MSFATATQLSPEPIVKVATAFMAAKHLFVSNEIGLFEKLGDGSSTLDDLASSSGVPRRTLRIVADAMVALGFVQRDGDRYANAPVAAEYLSGRSPADMRAFLRFFNHISYPGWLKLEDAVRTGKGQSRHGLFSEQEQLIFCAGVEVLTAEPAQALAASYDFSQHRRVLDLGGGTGSFLIPVLRGHPHLEATLFELRTVVPIAEKRLRSDSATRAVGIVGGDFFADPIPDGHDAVIVANVVHLFSPERNRTLLERLRRRAPAGARLLLVDFWTDSSHTQPPLAALLAGEFLIIAGEGDVYSEEEVREWLEATGWRFLERKPLAGPAGLIVAERTRVAPWE